MPDAKPAAVFNPYNLLSVREAGPEKVKAYWDGVRADAARAAAAAPAVAAAKLKKPKK